ncbi:MAG: DNA primase [Acidimicrobiales bacterium]
MAIRDEDVARVRAATDIVALIGEHSGLKRSGRRFVARCPFHEEKTASFNVNAEEGLYYCFGCQASGDAITFVRETQHVDFVEAVRQLADRAGITIQEDAVMTAENAKRAPLYNIMSKSVEWYHERLLSAPDAGRARDYLRSRGYGGDIVRQFQLGWAPDEWDALSRYLKSQPKLLEDSGLAFVNRAGRQQDNFRARVLFPIFDPSGKAVAIGGRILPSNDGGTPGPKYKNSQETAIYSKRRVLYGLNWAKADVVASGEVIVCEGYTDVIGFFSAGLPRAVATCGTALAEEHFRLLRNFAGRVVLAYDADAAGAAGASRVYEWERQHQVDVAVAALPAGSDPGDLARTDPDALRESVEKAKPFLAFRLARTFEAANLKSVEGRAKAADWAIVSVLEHPNELVRDQYLMEIADRCRMEPGVIRERMDAIKANPSLAALPDQRNNGRDPGRRDPGRRDPARSDQVREEVRADRSAADVSRHGGNGSSAGPRPGLEALRLAIHDPDRISERLERTLFDNDVQARAFDVLALSEGVVDAISACEEEDPHVADLLRRLAVEEPGVDADDCVVQLVRAAAERSFHTLEAEARLDPRLVELVAKEAAQVKLDLERIGTSEAGLEAMDRLLAWLHRRETDA